MFQSRQFMVRAPTRTHSPSGECFLPGFRFSSKLGVSVDRGSLVNANDFRRIALSLEGAEESSHMGQPDFRVGGRIFATLASAHLGYGNLMLTVEQQQAFVEELPAMFLPIAGGWGRMGMTHIRLAATNEDVLSGALRTAWKLRVEKNVKSGKKAKSSVKAAASPKARRKKAESL
jgi:hypothetical protein